MHSEKAVASTTKPIARRPPCSCTQRETPWWLLGLQRQRAAGDEPRDAGHRVEGEHEHVASQDAEHVAAVADRERRFQDEDLLIAVEQRGDDPHRAQQAGGGHGRAGEPAPSTTPGVRCQARSVVRVLAHAVGERVGEASIPSSASAAAERLLALKRSCGTSHIASAAIRQDILLWPRSRSLKTIGTSTT